MISDKKDQIQDIVSRLAALVPNKAWNSTVSLAFLHKPNLYHAGTGTLFQIADVYFVVTAAHVVIESARLNRPIALSSGDNKFVGVKSGWFRTGKDEDPGLPDVAICILDDEEVAKLVGKKFLRLSDLDLKEDCSKGYFCLFGYPGCWTKPIDASNETLIIRGLEFGATYYLDSTESFEKFEPKYHILLEADRRHMYSTKPDIIQLPTNLEGISGCSVWRLGEFSIPIQYWKPDNVQLVGVQTGVYTKGKIIKSTRWNLVLGLIMIVRPDLEAAINLRL